MAHEKRLLTDVFGDRYREYAANVPAFLPRATPYRPGEEGTDGFRWARYRRNREYEAGFGAVAAFGFLLAKALWAA
jgi:hypothetical protein